MSADFAYRGAFRPTPVPSCVLTRADLERLFEDLERRGYEGLEHHLATAARNPGTTTEEFEGLKQQARDAYRLVMWLYGADGEQVAVTSRTDLAELRFPEPLTTVTFDSAINLRVLHNWEPDNRLRISLDFTEPPGFDRYDPNNSPTPNSSKIEVTGPNGTWVSGVHESTVAFFRKHGRKRAWLHSHGTYNLYQWAIALPGALWVTFRIGSVLDQTFPQAHAALRGIAYVYVFLVAFLLARIIARGLRWIFPLVELEGTRSVRARAVVGAVFASLLLALLYDVLTTLIS